MSTDPIPSLRIWVPALLLALAWDPSTVSAADAQNQILILYSTRRDAEIVAVTDRTLPRVLDRGLGRQADYYSEFFDQSRFTHEDYVEAFCEFLARKYKDIGFDAIVAMDDIALQIIERYRADLFPSAPIVYFSTNRTRSPPPNSTGVIAELNLRGTLDLAIALQPDLRHAFVVTGNAESDRAFEAQARAQLSPLASRVEITYLTGLATSDLEARLARLPPHSMVYYLIVYRDAANENIQPLEYIDRVASVANAPTYSWVDSAIGHGIVGGNVKRQESQVEAMGAVALRVLRGERADRIPVSAPDLNVNEVDWRQLRRWNISERHAPRGTLVLFRSQSVWMRYGGWLTGAAVLMLVQSILIGGLLIQRASRRRAEGEAKASETKLRSSYDRIRALGRRLLTAQEEERSRIARELHDDVGQQVALLEIDLELLERSARSPATGLAHEALNLAREIGKSVHDLSHRLHPAKLQLVGLVSAIEGLRRELSQPGLTITFDHDNLPRTVPADVTVSLFRVIQEALQNALKYSHARNVSIYLRYRAGQIAATIEDDGIGFDVDAASGRGLGLISMSERMEAIGGKLEIRSTPGTGVQLHVTARLSTEQRPPPARAAL